MLCQLAMMSFLAVIVVAATRGEDVKIAAGFTTFSINIQQDCA